MAKQYKSDALAAAHETALGMAEADVMAKRTMRTFDEICLTPVEEMTPEEIRLLNGPLRRPKRAESGPARGGTDTGTRPPRTQAAAIDRAGVDRQRRSPRATLAGACTGTPPCPPSSSPSSAPPSHSPQSSSPANTPHAATSLDSTATSATFANAWPGLKGCSRASRAANPHPPRSSPNLPTPGHMQEGRHHPTKTAARASATRFTMRLRQSSPDTST